MSGPQAEPIVFVVPNQKVTTRHYVADFKGDDFDIRLTQTCTLEYEAVCDALVSYLNLMTSLDAEQQLFFMGVMVDAMRGQDCGTILIHGERYLYLPDPHGDRDRDTFMRFAEAQQKPSKKRKTAPTKKAKAKPKSARKERDDAKAK
jgi:hypothetical protein